MYMYILLLYVIIILLYYILPMTYMYMYVDGSQCFFFPPFPCMQASFWTLLSKPNSEKFFREIHNKFIEARTEIKNSPMGLVIQQQVRDWDTLVILLLCST